MIFNEISVLFVYFCCPETRRKSSEEIDLVFMAKNPEATRAGQRLVRARLESVKAVRDPSEVSESGSGAQDKEREAGEIKIQWFQLFKGSLGVFEYRLRELCVLFSPYFRGKSKEFS